MNVKTKMMVSALVAALSLGSCTTVHDGDTLTVTGSSDRTAVLASSVVFLAADRAISKDPSTAEKFRDVMNAADAVLGADMVLTDAELAALVREASGGDPRVAAVTNIVLNAYTDGIDLSRYKGIITAMIEGLRSAVEVYDAGIKL